MLPSFCHLFGKLPFSVLGTLVLCSSRSEWPKRFVLVAFYSQDFSLQLLQISFGSVTYGPNWNVEQFEYSYAIILHTFIAQLFAIALFILFRCSLWFSCCSWLSILCPSSSFSALLLAVSLWPLTINFRLLIRRSQLNAQLIINWRSQLNC